MSIQRKPSLLALVFSTSLFAISNVYAEPSLTTAAAVGNASFTHNFDEVPAENGRLIQDHTLTDQAGNSVSATFRGGRIYDHGIAGLYRSGQGSWLIKPAGTSVSGESSGVGTIDLAKAAGRLSFYIRSYDDNTVGTVRILDAQGDLLREVPAADIVSNQWTPVDFSALAGSPLASRVEVENMGTGTIAVDDMAFTAGAQTQPPGNESGGNAQCPFSYSLEAKSANQESLKNAFDNDLSTRAYFEEGYIQLDFCKPVNLKSVKVAFYNATKLQYAFKMYATNDQGGWTKLYTGNSDGVTTGFENFDFPDITTTTFRIVGKGNNKNTWNSYTEIQPVTSDTTTPPTEPPSDPNVVLEKFHSLDAWVLSGKYQSVNKNFGREPGLGSFVSNIRGAQPGDLPYYRSELSSTTGKVTPRYLELNKHHWMGLSVYIPSDFQNDNFKKYNENVKFIHDLIWQVHIMGVHGQPPMSAVILGDKVQVGSNLLGGARSNVPLTKGAWMDWVVHVFSTPTHTTMQAWANGNLVFNRVNEPVEFPEGGSLYFKFGQYSFYLRPASSCSGGARTLCEWENEAAIGVRYDQELYHSAFRYFQGNNGLERVKPKGSRPNNRP